VRSRDKQDVVCAHIVGVVCMLRQTYQRHEHMVKWPHFLSLRYTSFQAHCYIEVMGWLLGGREYVRSNNCSVINTHNSSVELISTALSAIPGPMSSSNWQVCLQCWFSLSSCCLVATSELLKLEIFWNINLDQTAGTHKKIWTPNGLSRRIRGWNYKRQVGHLC
jgi:hypothetical protein